MLDVIKGHSETLGVFLGGIKSGEKPSDNYEAALEAIKAGASTMRSESEKSTWTWAARHRLMDLARIRIALDGFIADPEKALKRVGGRAIGYGTAQLWADMAVEIVKGDWEEARERRKMSPAELVLFAVGPFGLIVLYGLHGNEVVPKAAEAVGLEDEYEELQDGLETTKQGVERAIFWIKVGAGVVVAGAAVAGTVAVVNSVRSRK